MIISTSANLPAQTLPPFNSPAASSQGTPAQTGGTLSSVNESDTPPSKTKDTPEDTRVTLAATPASKAYAPEFTPIYAEIWKDGMKIAEIDVHGGVNSVSGLVAPAPGTVGGGGALLAARRAAEIVRSVGGEIRVGGQVMDSQTLEMRARLKIAYGV